MPLSSASSTSSAVGSVMLSAIRASNLPPNSMSCANGRRRIVAFDRTVMKAASDCNSSSFSRDAELEVALRHLFAPLAEVDEGRDHLVVQVDAAVRRRAGEPVGVEGAQHRAQQRGLAQVDDVAVGAQVSQQVVAPLDVLGPVLG